VARLRAVNALALLAESRIRAAIALSTDAELRSRLLIERR
jgi:hypothetical protein